MKKRMMNGYLAALKSMPDETEKSNEIAVGHMDAYLAYKRFNKANARYYLWVAKQADPQVYQQYLNKIPKADQKAVTSMSGEVEF